MIIDDRKTDTTIFLVPVLGIERNKLDNHNFIDGFLDDVSRMVHHMNSIYILFKPNNMEEFQEFLEMEKERYPDIVDDYDYSGGYVVVVYKFPKDLLPDMQLILEGKYSQTSMDFKKRFAQVKKIVTESGLRRDAPSLQWMVFKKASAVREEWERVLDIRMEEEAEVWGMPDMAREILDMDLIRKKEDKHVQQ